VIGKLLNFCLRTVFPKAAVLLRNIKILAAEQGQWRSIAQRSAVDRQGQPLPWYTYPAIEYLNTFDLSNCNVFEFGAGNSSLYWARRARTVTSVEDDAQWHEQVQARALPNQDLLHRRDRDGYVAAIENGAAPYDVIVIDGKHRIECTNAAIPQLSPGGMIILDNSDRATERSCSALLRGAEFIQVDFCGFGPINGYAWCTSVFFRPTFSMPRKADEPRPVGATGDAL
jgi:hypothetical protein